MTTFQETPAQLEAPAYTLTFPDGRPVPSFLSVAQVAELFSITTESVYTAIRKDELYARKFTARQFRVTLAAALAWFNADSGGTK